VVGEFGAVVVIFEGSLMFFIPLWEISNR